MCGTSQRIRGVAVELIHDEAAPHARLLLTVLRGGGVLEGGADDDQGLVDLRREAAPGFNTRIRSGQG